MTSWRVPIAAWVGLLIFSTTSAMAAIALLAQRDASLAVLDSVLDNWAAREAPRAWRTEPASMTMDLPTEFGAARSVDVWVLVADDAGTIRSRSRDWPKDIDLSSWITKSAPIPGAPPAGPSTQMVWGGNTIFANQPVMGVGVNGFAGVLSLPPGAVPSPFIADGPSTFVVSGAADVALRHFLTHGQTGTTRWVEARGGPFTLFAGVPQSVVNRAVWPLAWTFGAGVLLATLLGAAITVQALSNQRRERETLVQWVRQAADGLPTATEPPGQGPDLGELCIHLARLRSRLAASLEQASRFTGDAAHELRSPLTAMQVKVDRLINRSDPASEVQKDLADIADDIHRLSSLVRRLFWMALADAGRLQLHRVPIDLSKVLREVVEEVTETASGLSIDVRIDSGLSVEGDAPLLTHALANLMSNAVKHNRAEGWVKIAADYDVADACISVRNSVAHPLPISRERVFERFFRGSFARSAKDSGSGIGLSLAREIARAHGGDILVEDTPRDEAWFTLRLPATSHPT